MGDRNLSDDLKGDLFVIEIFFLKIMWFSESKVGNLLRCLLNVNSNLEWHKTVRLVKLDGTAYFALAGECASVERKHDLH
ncbi:hypothetical protein [Faucicola boevrei]|uniref:hypothetical protein n=1 Tax=Faucicola boevrei TaxID=346665 RepID=UPI0003A708B4|nr:hypothetical protein [Moraxella boevrei]